MFKSEDVTKDQLEWEKEVDINQPITAGVEEQVHEVLQRIFNEFEDTVEGPRMATFQKIWRETSFGLIFHGRESFRELYSFSEELLDIVKQFAVKTRQKAENPEGLRYAATYLLYALYFKQPCRPMVKIRFTLDEFEEMQDLIEDAKDGSHYDVVYAWAKLFTEGAFHYVAAPGHLGIELALQLEQKEIRAKDPKKKYKQDFLSSVQFRKLMKNVMHSHEQYEKVKKQFIETNPESKNLLCLNGTDQDFPSTLLSIVEGKKSTESSNDVEDIGEKRRRIKNKFIEVDSYRDQLLAESEKRANNLLEDDAYIRDDDDFHNQLDRMELQDKEQEDSKELDDTERFDNRVPFQGKPRSKLRGKWKRMRAEPKRRSGVDHSNAERMRTEPKSKDAALHKYEVSFSATRGRGGRGGRRGTLARGKRGRGIQGRGPGNTSKVFNRGIQGRGPGNTSKVFNGGNVEDMVDVEGILEATSVGDGSSGASPGGRGNVKMNRGGLKCSGEQVGEMSRGDGRNQVGEKMEKGKMKRKNKLGMWGNAIIRNPPQEEKVEQEPEFRFNKKSE